MMKDDKQNLKDIINAQYCHCISVTDIGSIEMVSLKLLQDLHQSKFKRNGNVHHVQYVYRSNSYQDSCSLRGQIVNAAIGNNRRHSRDKIGQEN
jgi:hypothetical protein